MEITVSVTKSSLQGRGPVLFKLTYLYTLSSSAGKSKVVVIAVFLSKLTAQHCSITLRNYSSVRTGFNND